MLRLCHYNNHIYAIHPKRAGPHLASSLVKVLSRLGLSSVVLIKSSRAGLNFPHLTEL